MGLWRLKTTYPRRPRLRVGLSFSDKCFLGTPVHDFTSLNHHSEHLSHGYTKEADSHVKTWMEAVETTELGPTFQALEPPSNHLRTASCYIVAFCGIESSTLPRWTCTGRGTFQVIQQVAEIDQAEFSEIPGDLKADSKHGGRRQLSNGT